MDSLFGAIKEQLNAWCEGRGRTLLAERLDKCTQLSALSFFLSLPVGLVVFLFDSSDNHPYAHLIIRRLGVTF